MFRFFEQSLIMSAAILLMIVLVRVLGDKVRPAKRHLCYVIIFVALIVPFRPDVFSVRTPMPEAGTMSETYVAYNTPRRGLEAAFSQTQELMQSWNSFRAYSVPVFNRYASYSTTYAVEYVIKNDLTETYPFSANINMTLYEGSAVGIWQNITIHQLLLYVWGAGIFVFLGISVFRHMRFALALRRHSLHIENGPAYEILCRIRRSLGLGKIRLWSNPIVTVPVMFGLLRPTIVLPEYETYVDENKLNLFILHEALHIRRQDLITKLLSTVALALHWFNPLVHWLNRRANEECERACDEAVIEFMGTENRLNYSQTLLFAAKQSHGIKKATLAYALSDDGKKMKNRLISIMNNVTPKRWALITCTSLLITVVMTFSLVSCGGSDNEPAETTTYTQNDITETTNQTTDTTQPEPDSLDRFRDETLTISIFADNFIRPFIHVFMVQNPGVTVDVIDFAGNWERGREQTNLQLMTGTAPALLDSSFVDYRDPSVARFLIDWFPIMDADPYFNEDDFFMNVFHASAIGGRLYAFPHAFSYTMVTANSTIPGLTQAFEGFGDGITASQLLDLHRQTPTESPMFFERNFDVTWGMWEYLHNFIDMETHWVDFDNQRFIDFIYYAREITSPDTNFGWMTASTVTSQEEEAAWSQRYFFQYTTPRLFQYLIDFEEDLLFASAIPIVSDHGELVMHTWRAHALNAQATPVQQDLAWEFMRFLASVESHASSNVWRTHIMPVNRNLLRFAIEREMFNDIDYLTQQYGWRPYGNRDDIIENVITRLTTIGDLPMVSQQAPETIQSIIMEALEDFHFGLVSGEETAQDLQRRITLVMMEMG